MYIDNIYIAEHTVTRKVWSKDRPHPPVGRTVKITYNKLRNGQVRRWYITWMCLCYLLKFLGCRYCQIYIWYMIKRYIWYWNDFFLHFFSIIPKVLYKVMQTYCQAIHIYWYSQPPPETYIAIYNFLLLLTMISSDKYIFPQVEELAILEKPLLPN